jgi:hypothetical protein
MTFDFPLPMMVEGQVVTAGVQYGCRQQVCGVSWPMIPPEGWRYTVRKVKALLHSKGAICEFCAEVSTHEGPCSRHAPCAPVRMTIVTGRGSFPLTDDLLTTYSALDRFRLIATTTKYRPLQPYAQQEVAAHLWAMAEPEKRHERMQKVVGELAQSFGIPAAETRTFIWEGTREIAYQHHWAREFADQDR